VKRPRPLRLAALLAGILLVAAVGTITLPSLVFRDAPAPAHIAPYVDDGRASLHREAVRLLPLQLRLASARCRADGGALLVFEQWELPYLGFRYGYVMSGTWPPEGWGGGVGMEDLSADPEIAAFMGADEVPCE
jgi:hypothetical protein